MNILKIGAVKVRHEMPVDDFIFEGTIRDITNLDYIASVVAEKIGLVDKVELYVTGLTVITVEVIKYCTEFLIPLELFHYNDMNGDYFKQEVIKDWEHLLSHQVSQ